MTALADNPTAAAVLSAFPCYPVPPCGRSPALEALRDAQVGRGLAVGRDGVMLILRRPWLALDVPIASPMGAHLPYGDAGIPKADLRCGLIPRHLLDDILNHFRASLPNEAAAFVVWNDADRSFAVEFPAIDHASPAHLVYRTPVLPQGRHLVVDLHSHGTLSAFFSVTDDADDLHATKIAMVFGNLSREDGPTVASRLCADGMFLPMPRSPFAEAYHAA